MRVVIVEDNALLRDGLALLLADAGIDVAATRDDAAGLTELVGREQPDLVVLDVRLPPGFTDEGIRAALELRARHPAVGVLVLSQWVEVTYARQLLTDGASSVGYLLKDRVMRSADFLDAVHRVAAGGTALDEEVVGALLARGPVSSRLQRLSEREREVLALLAEGRSNRAIADALHLALRSVEKVIAAVFHKLDLTDEPDGHRRVLAVLRYLRAHG